jgi:antitoxin component YwqK of YwqJK toxin-antitoxin module
MHKGDCKLGKWDGKGIKYYENGNKMNEGDFKNGYSIEEKGILYDKNGNIISKGDDNNFEHPKRRIIIKWKYRIYIIS